MGEFGMDVMTGQVPVDPPWPPCENHVEKQYRNGGPPYCRNCGWYRGKTAVPAQKVCNPLGGWGTP